MDHLYSARVKMASAATCYHKLRHHREVDDDELLEAITSFDSITEYPELDTLIDKFKAVITEEAKKRKLL